MPRLIDDIRARGQLEMPWFVEPRRVEQWKRHAAKVAEMLRWPDVPVLRIDNVSDYYFAAEQEHWSLDRDFPNLAPPFPVMWVEHHLPRTIHSAECGDNDLTKWVQRGAVGVLIIYGDAATAVCTEGAPPPNAKWILCAELFVDYGRNITQGPHGTIMLCVDAEGRAIDAPWMQTWSAESEADVMKSFMTWLHPAFLAVSFLHCKNVAIQDNVIPAKLAKRYRERNGIAPANYKTLVIEPLKAILRTEGRSGEHGLAKAMHICRGHFKDYREGRGLFGKYHQLVWQPSIVRGTKGEKAPPREIEVKV
jgi:hypothetical protein